MDALCALLDCALGFFPCYFLFGCNHILSAPICRGLQLGPYDSGVLPVEICVADPGHSDGGGDWLSISSQQDLDDWIREWSVWGLVGPIPDHSGAELTDPRRYSAPNAVRHLSELEHKGSYCVCLLYTSPSPRDRTRSRMPSSA